MNEKQLETELEETKKALDEMRHGYCLIKETGQEQNKMTSRKKTNKMKVHFKVLNYKKSFSKRVDAIWMLLFLCFGGEEKLDRKQR